MSKEIELQIYDVVKIVDGVGSIWIDSIEEIDTNFYYTSNFSISKDLLKVRDRCSYKQDYQLDIVWRLDEHRNYIMIYPVNKLVEYEAIKNAEQSEALECLEELCRKAYKRDCFTEESLEALKNTIKQALLKTQQQKHYLKWEDLEFKKEVQETFVLLNGTKYKMCYINGCYECINLFTEDGKRVVNVFEGFFPQDKQFFNNLHLEKVEK